MLDNLIKPTFQKDLLYPSFADCYELHIKNIIFYNIGLFNLLIRDSSSLWERTND